MCLGDSDRTHEERPRNRGRIFWTHPQLHRSRTRVSELCGLELTDVDLDRELACVTGKGSRPRVVPFGSKTAPDVDRYLSVRALHPHDRPTRLLLGRRGPMTPDGARNVPHTRAAQAGVTDVYPHRFRHTFAHRWLAGGGQ